MSSGNLLADRRMEFARDMHARGDLDAAIDLLGQALELAPDWVEGAFLYGEWQDQAGRRDGAVAAYTRCLTLDPDDRMGAVLRLSLLGAVARPPVLPAAYVAGVFDEYAAAFDTALVERLDYAVPGALASLVLDRAGEAPHFARVLDLGCGTGLAGERFRAVCSWLEGVDLSPGMIGQARRKGFYDSLAAEDVVVHLERSRDRYDLILAADVLVYLGDLDPLFTAAAGALGPGGRFAFSVEKHGGADGFGLTPGHRFAHSEAYLRECAHRAGMTVETVTPTICRQEAGRPVHGLLVVLRGVTEVVDEDLSIPAIVGLPRHAS